MKKILFVVSALAILMGISASCQKELNNGQAISAGEGTASSLVVTATIADNSTKVSYAEDGTTPNPGLKPTWEENDIIIGFDGEGNTYAYEVTSVDGTTKKATLERITEGDEAVKGTAESDPADGTEMYMFYAPGTNPSAIINKSLTVSLANQAEDVVPALMMAEATVTDGSLSLSFSNQTAIIGIKTPTMSIASKPYTGIAVSGAGINTEVKFGLNASSQLEATYQTLGTIVKAMGSITSGTDKKISETVYVVACPLTTAADLTFTASNGESFTKTSREMAAGQYYYMTPTFSAPPAALSGEFTVKAASGTEPAKKVRFSPGNLRCYPVGTSGTYTSGVWSFFDKQYECGPASYNGGHDKEISLFTWGYDATKSIDPDGWDYVTDHTTNESFAPNEDWGTQIGDGNTWRTLTKAEWEWLLGPSSSPNPGTDCRTSSEVNGTENARYLKCKVNDGTRDVYGLMIFPDEFTWPSGTDAPPLPTANYINKKNLIWTTTDFPAYSSTQFEALETAGVVFLPAAGYRQAGSSVYYVGSNGGYWSSTAYSSTEAYAPDFDGNDVNLANYGSRSRARSVRLVSDVQ